MKKQLFWIALFAVIFSVNAQVKATPIFKDGEAQIVEALKDRKDWIRHDL